eukprot:SAG31_NODE_1178_length_9531_cov_3.040818_4_plen_169_part_00
MQDRNSAICAGVQARLLNAPSVGAELSTLQRCAAAGAAHGRVGAHGGLVLGHLAAARCGRAAAVPATNNGTGTCRTATAAVGMAAAGVGAISAVARHAGRRRLHRHLSRFGTILAGSSQQWPCQSAISRQGSVGWLATPGPPSRSSEKRLQRFLALVARYLSIIKITR